MKCEELTQIELEYVSGGFRNFLFGYLVSVSYTHLTLPTILLV